MSEEQPIQEANILPKNYLLMADELTIAFLGKIIPSLKYVEIEGMTMVDKPTHQLLVNPLPKPKEEVVEPKVELVENE